MTQAEIDYKQHVKTIYKRSKCVRAEFGHVIITAFNEGLSFEMETEEKAWEDAYNKLKSKGKL